MKNWGPRAEENGLKLLPADSYGYYTEFDNREKPWRGCPAGIVSVGITSNGKIKGCLSLPDEIYGSTQTHFPIRDNFLKTCWVLIVYPVIIARSVEVDVRQCPMEALVYFIMTFTVFMESGSGHDEINGKVFTSKYVRVVRVRN